MPQLNRSLHNGGALIQHNPGEEKAPKLTVMVTINDFSGMDPEIELKFFLGGA